MSDPTILAFDTSAAHCAAALHVGGQVAAQISQDMTRGQAERLIPMIQDLLNSANVALPDVQAIGVGTGPGNFTGIRVAISAARGLALARSIPAYGIPGMTAADTGTPALLSLPATRGQVYVQGAGVELQMLPLAQAQDLAASLGVPLQAPPAPLDMVNAIARHAAARFPDPGPAPKPLYLRPADAAPSRDQPPVLLD